MKHLIIILSIIFSCGLVKSQQIPIDNQYLINNFSLSPAFAGSSGNTEAFLGVRHNWVGIPGAPQKQILNFNMPIQKEDAGVGISIVNEETGNFEYFSALMSYAYHIELSRDMSVSLSLGVEAYRNQLDLSAVKLANADDPLLLNHEALKGTTFDATVSGVFFVNDFTAGFVIPRTTGIMKIKYDKEIEGNQYLLNRHYIVHASYPIEIDKNIVIKPYAIGRMTSNTPIFFEVSVLANYKKWLWGGATYRKGNSVGIHIGGSLDDKLIINYSYEFGFGNILSVSSGTHEISVGYLIKYGKRFESLTAFRKEVKKKAEDERVTKLMKDFKTHKKKTDTEIKKLKEEISNIKSDAEKEKVGEYSTPKRLKNIKFGHNSDKLFSSSFSALDKLVRKLKTNTKIEIMITGHTDNVGSPRYNLRLSKKRAESVKRYLVSQGISDSRIITDGKGETDPEQKNETKAGRAWNRRIMVAEKGE